MAARGAWRLAFSGRAAAAALLILGSGAVSAATYYVDATAGLDTHDGLSEATPWKSLLRVNDAYLAPGDAVLFKCGEQWSGQLKVNSSGTEAAPIRFGSYGSCNAGNKPLIDGGMNLSGWTAQGGDVYKASTYALRLMPVNPVVNPDFESGATTAPAGWQKWSEQGTAVMEQLASCAGGAGGCLRYVAAPAGGSTLHTNGYGMTMASGADYQLRFQARSTTGGANLTVTPRMNASPWTAASSAASFSLGTSWKSYSALVRATGSFNGNIRLDFQVPNGVELNLDSVVFRPVEGAPDTNPAEYRVKQVLLDGEMQRLAQHPNPVFDELGKPVKQFLAIAADSPGCPSPASGATGFNYGDDLVLTASQQADMVGAGVHVRTASWALEDLVVSGFDTTSRRVTFRNAVKSKDTSDYNTCKDFGYYFDNKRWMLDMPGEWYHNLSTKELLIKLAPGDSNPARAVVGYQPSAINASGRKYVTIDGLHLRHADIGIDLRAKTQGMVVKNCLITDTANDLTPKEVGVDKHYDYAAIYAPSTIKAEFRSNEIYRSGRNGIYANQSLDSKAIGNTIIDTGTVGAPRKSNAGIEFGCYECSNTQEGVGHPVIEDNTIQNSGYAGILVGRETTVRNNYVADSCTVLNDCAAIYMSGREFDHTEGDPAGFPTNNVVTANLVINSWGNPDGLPAGFVGSGEGIYLDDFSNNVEVSDNTVINAHKGFLLHVARDTKVLRNVVYGSRAQAVWMQEDFQGVEGATMIDNLFEANQFLQLGTQPSYRMDSSFNNNNFADYAGNRYSLLSRGPIAIENYKPAGAGGTTSSTTYDLARWQAQQESNATAFDLFSIASEQVTAVTAGNLISNGDFASGATGWGSYSNNPPTHTVTVIEPCISGGKCLQLQAGVDNALVNTSSFDAYKDQQYRLRFDVKGGLVNQTVKIYLREGGPTYGNLAAPVILNVQPEWQSYSRILTATKDYVRSASVNGARVDFEVASGQSLQIDNVRIEKVSTQMLTDEQRAQTSAILVNPAASDASLPCPATTDPATRCAQYVDFVTEAPVSFPLNVPARRSRIVVWAGSPLVDSDGDGIANANELASGTCNATPQGTPADENGCSFAQQHPADVAMQPIVPSPASVTVGSNVNWKIDLRNNGQTTAHGVQLSATVPAGHAYVSSAPGGCSLSGSSVNCAVGDIAAGATASVTITTRATSVGSATLTATSSRVAEKDPDTSNDGRTSSAVTAVSPNAEVVINSFAASSTSVLTEAQYTYTLTIKNNGPATAANVKASFTPFTGLIVKSLGSTHSGSCQTSPTPICTIPSLANGAIATVTLTVSTDPEAIFHPTTTLQENRSVSVNLSATEDSTPVSGSAATTVKLACEGQAVTNTSMRGTSAINTIYGTSGPDVIHGLGGDDTIQGWSGNDTICGGSGNDKLYGWSGDDLLSGGAGTDLCNGDGNTDTSKACESGSTENPL